MVVLKTLDVVSCMVKHSGDFLRKRLSTEFLPIALQFLRDHATSFSKNKSRFTQLHKVLNKLIVFMGNVLVELDVGLKDFCNIASLCSNYLSCQLHESVQVVSFIICFFILIIYSITTRSIHCYPPNIDLRDNTFTSVKILRY